MKINTALILCAGLGKRLNPITLETPKPLLKLNNIPILETCIDTIIKSETPEAYQQALEDMRNWNSTYPMYPILVTDIDYKAVIKRKMQKHKKRADV